MTRKQETGARLMFSRREALAAGGACFAMLSQKALAAMGAEPAGPGSVASRPETTFTKEVGVGRHGRNHRDPQR